jgi:hypothetical protein
MALNQIFGPWPSIKTQKFIENSLVTVGRPVALRLETGAAISAYSGEHTDGWNQYSNKELMLRWNNGGSSHTKMAAMFILPDDLDTTEDLTVHFLAAVSSTNDTPTMQVEAYMVGVGSAPASDSNCGGYSSGEVTATGLYVDHSFTISADDLISGEAQLTVIFNPVSGELVTDDFLSSPPWIEFTRL